MSTEDIFDTKTRERIVAHMNEDHADALCLYLKAFLNIDTENAEMTDIDAHGIGIQYQAGEKPSEEVQHVHLTFEQTGVTKALQSAAEARDVLVEMVKVARQ